MTYIKKADRERLGLNADGTPANKGTLIGPAGSASEPALSAPAAIQGRSMPSVEDPKVTELRGMVEGLQAQLKGLTAGRRTGATQRNRTRQHVCTLREFAVDDEVKGLVTKLYGVKEIKDKTENKRFYGICSVDVLNPLTKETTTYRDVDYLQFLNNAQKVKAKILNWRKEVRYEVEAIGPLYKQTQDNSFIAETDYEFEVGYTDHNFTLEVVEGAYAGAVVETDDKALNI